jgi:phosphatidate cytidylyltransferase
MTVASAKFEGLLQRVRTALVLLPFVIIPVVLGGWLFTLLLAIAGYLMAREWANLLRASMRDGHVLGGITVMVLIYGGLVGAAEALALMIVLLCAGLSFAWWRGARASVLSGGLLYVAMPLVTAQFFRADPMGALIIGYILLSVWAVDIFAMFSGKIIGGPKLAPVISPNKTWAGLVGAMGGAIIAAILSFLVIVGFQLGVADFMAMLIIAPLLAVCAQIADLFESAIKRKYNIKDSGAIIPGHGGLLDRVDGLVGVLLILLIVVWLRGGDVAHALWVWS